MARIEPRLKVTDAFQLSLVCEVTALVRLQLCYQVFSAVDRLMHPPELRLLTHEWVILTDFSVL